MCPCARVCVWFWFWFWFWKGPKQLLKLHRYLEGRGLQLATCQVQLSLLSYGELQRDVLSVCDDLGIKVIAYSPLALGILTGKYNLSSSSSSSFSFSAGNADEQKQKQEVVALPSGLRGFAFKSLLPGAAPLLRELDAVALSLDATPAQVALAWCMRKNTIPIPGAKTIKQAEGNVLAAQVVVNKLTQGHEDALEQAANRCSKRMVQNIFQTK